jgi:hypothetical protein
MALRRQDDFDRFVELVQQKCERGEREYGDHSFHLPTTTTIEELQAEALDICGWGWVLWTRLEALKQRAAALPAQ